MHCVVLYWFATAYPFRAVVSLFSAEKDKGPRRGHGVRDENHQHHDDAPGSHPVDVPPSRVFNLLRFTVQFAEFVAVVAIIIVFAVAVAVVATGSASNGAFVIVVILDRLVVGFANVGPFFIQFATRRLAEMVVAATRSHWPSASAVDTAFQSAFVAS